MVELLEISKGFHFIKVPGVRLIRGVTAIVGDDSYVTLIDCAGVGQSHFTFEYLQKCSIDPSKIKAIVLTHFDSDHVGAAVEIKSQTNCKIFAPDFFESRIIQGERFSREQLSQILPSYNANELDALHAKLAKQDYAPLHVDETLVDGRQLPIGGGASIISVPGHNPGHVVVYLPKKSALISGDTMEVSNGKVKAETHATVSTRLAIQSLRKLSNLDFEVLVPSHYDPILRGGSKALKEYLSTVA